MACVVGCGVSAVWLRLVRDCGGVWLAFAVFLLCVVVLHVLCLYGV